MSKKVFNSKGELVSDTRFLYSGFKCVAELDALKKRVIRFYQWQGEQLLGVVDVKSGKRLACLTDGNKNVVGLIDNSGEISASYAYSPFGKLISAKGADAPSCSFGFSSEYRDDESGLVYYNYRYLNPKLGRWMTRDPIMEGGGCNQYAMVENKILQFVDFLGLTQITPQASTSPQAHSWASSYCSSMGGVQSITFVKDNGWQEVSRKDGRKGVPYTWEEKQAAIAYMEVTFYIVYQLFGTADEYYITMRRSAKWHVACNCPQYEAGFLIRGAGNKDFWYGESKKYIGYKNKKKNKIEVTPKGDISIDILKIIKNKLKDKFGI